MIRFRRSTRGGFEVFHKEDKIWHLTWKTKQDFGSGYEFESNPELYETPDESVDEDELKRELFGETLDEPIPDDLWDMLR